MDFQTLILALFCTYISDTSLRWGELDIDGYCAIGFLRGRNANWARLFRLEGLGRGT